MAACRWPIGCICRRAGPATLTRRKKAGVPEEIGFQTKIEIALDQIRAAHAAGLPRGAGADGRGLWHPHTDLRTAITALGLPYVAGILSSTTVWAPGTGRLPPKP